jgi:phosphomannomutase
MDAMGNFVDPHHIFALALRYLVEKRAWKGKVVKTVSTTLMIDRLAARYGLSLVETPVGFNHIADHMLKGDVLMGGEESGGLSIQGHIPEGDGVLMGLLLLEIMADAGVPLHELIADIQQVAGPACYARTDLRLRHPVVKAEMVDRLVGGAPSHIGRIAVDGVDTLDGVKYRLEDESWLLIRPSGTEPVLRVYAEAPRSEGVKALLDFGEEVAASA